MTENIPKVVKVGNAANILELTFDNGQTKYLRTHNVQDHLDSWSAKRGKGKRINLFLNPANVWPGSDPRILADGTVVLFEKDKYTPTELWQNSADSVTTLNMKK